MSSFCQNVFALMVNSLKHSQCWVGELGGFRLFTLVSPVSPGDGVRGGGCCANLPVFFSQNSGLVAVVARESASILPEMMEDSLCSSLTAAPEVSPRRAEAPERRWLTRVCVLRSPWTLPSGLSRSLRTTKPSFSRPRSCSSAGASPNTRRHRQQRPGSPSLL